MSRSPSHKRRRDSQTTPPFVNEFSVASNPQQACDGTNSWSDYQRAQEFAASFPHWIKPQASHWTPSFFQPYKQSTPNNYGPQEFEKKYLYTNVFSRSGPPISEETLLTLKSVAPNVEEGNGSSLPGYQKPQEAKVHLEDPHSKYISQARISPIEEKQDKVDKGNEQDLQQQKSSPVAKASFEESNFIQDIEKAPQKAHFSCSYCNVSYIYKRAYLKHMSTHCPELGYKDPKPTPVYASPSKSSDMQVWYPELPQSGDYTCDVCGLKYRYKKPFLKHIMTHNQDSKEPLAEPYSTESDKEDLLGGPKYSCIYCNATYLYKRAYQKHLQTHTPEDIEEKVGTSVVEETLKKTARDACIEGEATNPTSSVASVHSEPFSAEREDLPLKTCTSEVTVKPFAKYNYESNFHTKNISSLPENTMDYSLGEPSSENTFADSSASKSSMLQRKPINHSPVESSTIYENLISISQKNLLAIYKNISGYTPESWEALKRNLINMSQKKSNPTLDYLTGYSSEKSDTYCEDSGDHLQKEFSSLQKNLMNYSSEYQMSQRNLASQSSVRDSDCMYKQSLPHPTSGDYSTICKQSVSQSPPEASCARKDLDHYSTSKEVSTEREGLLYLPAAGSSTFRENLPYSPSGEPSTYRENHPYSPAGEPSTYRENHPYALMGESSSCRENLPFPPVGEPGSHSGSFSYPPAGESSIHRENLCYSPSGGSTTCQEKLPYSPSRESSIHRESLPYSPAGESSTQRGNIPYSPSGESGSHRENLPYSPSGDSSCHRENLSYSPSGESSAHQENLPYSPSGESSTLRENLPYSPCRESSTHRESLSYSPSGESNSHRENLYSPSGESKSHRENFSYSPGESSSQRENHSFAPSGDSNSHRQNLTYSQAGESSTHRDNLPYSPAGGSNTHGENLTYSSAGESSTHKENLSYSLAGESSTHRENLPYPAARETNAHRDNLPYSPGSESSVRIGNIGYSSAGESCNQRENLQYSPAGEANTHGDNLPYMQSSTHGENHSYSSAGDSSSHRENLSYSPSGNSSTHKENLNYCSVGESNCQRENLPYPPGGESSFRRENSTYSQAGDMSCTRENLSYSPTKESSTHRENISYALAGKAGIHRKNLSYSLAGESGAHREDFTYTTPGESSTHGENLLYPVGGESTNPRRDLPYSPVRETSSHGENIPFSPAEETSIQRESISYASVRESSSHRENLPYSPSEETNSHRERLYVSAGESDSHRDTFPYSSSEESSTQRDDLPYSPSRESNTLRENLSYLSTGESGTHRENHPYSPSEESCTQGQNHPYSPSRESNTPLEDLPYTSVGEPSMHRGKHPYSLAEDSRIQQDDLHYSPKGIDKENFPYSSAVEPSVQRENLPYSTAGEQNVQRGNLPYLTQEEQNATDELNFFSSTEKSKINDEINEISGSKKSNGGNEFLPVRVQQRACKEYNYYSTSLEERHNEESYRYSPSREYNSHKKEFTGLLSNRESNHYSATEDSRITEEPGEYGSLPGCTMNKEMDFSSVDSNLTNDSKNYSPVDKSDSRDSCTYSLERDSPLKDSVDYTPALESFSSKESDYQYIQESSDHSQVSEPIFHRKSNSYSPEQESVDKRMSSMYTKGTGTIDYSLGKGSSIKETNAYSAHGELSTSRESSTYPYEGNSVDYSYTEDSRLYIDSLKQSTCQESNALEESHSHKARASPDRAEKSEISLPKESFGCAPAQEAIETSGLASSLVTRESPHHSLTEEASSQNTESVLYQGGQEPSSDEAFSSTETDSDRAAFEYLPSEDCDNPSLTDGTVSTKAISDHPEEESALGREVKGKFSKEKSCIDLSNYVIAQAVGTSQESDSGMQNEGQDTSMNSTDHLMEKPEGPKEPSHCISSVDSCGQKESINYSKEEEKISEKISLSCLSAERLNSKKESEIGSSDDDPEKEDTGTCNEASSLPSDELSSHQESVDIPPLSESSAKKESSNDSPRKESGTSVEVPSHSPVDQQVRRKSTRSKKVCTYLPPEDPIDYFDISESVICTKPSTYFPVDESICYERPRKATARKRSAKRSTARKSTSLSARALSDISKESSLYSPVDGSIEESLSYSSTTESKSLLGSCSSKKKTYTQKEPLNLISQKSSLKRSLDSSPDIGANSSKRTANSVSQDTYTHKQLSYSLSGKANGCKSLSSEDCNVALNLSKDCKETKHKGKKGNSEENVGHYSCSYCTATYSYKKAFLKHVASHTPQLHLNDDKLLGLEEAFLISGSDKYFCKICNISYSYKKAYTKHVATHTSVSSTSKHSGKAYTKHLPTHTSGIGSGKHNSKYYSKHNSSHASKPMSGKISASSAADFEPDVSHQEPSTIEENTTKIRGTKKQENRALTEASSHALASGIEDKGVPSPNEETVEKYRCSVCSITYSYHKAYVKHMSSHTLAEISENKQKDSVEEKSFLEVAEKYSCKYCNAMYSYRMAYIKHMANHTEGKGNEKAQNIASKKTVAIQDVQNTTKNSAPSVSKNSVSNVTKSSEPNGSKSVTPNVKSSASNAVKSLVPNVSASSGHSSTKDTVMLSKSSVLTTAKSSVLNVSRSPVLKASGSSEPGGTNRSLSDLSKRSVPNISKSSVPNVSKTSVPKVSKSQVPNVSKSSASNVSKNQVPDISKSSVPNASKSQVPNVSKNSLPNVSKGSKFCCTYCPLTYSYKKAFLKHVSTHESEAKEDLLGSGAIDLSRHKDSVTAPEKSIGQHCTKGMVLRDNSPSVSTRGSERKKFIRYEQKGDILIRQLELSNTSDYACVFCSATYSYRRAFIKHLNTHKLPDESGDPENETYFCVNCDKQFALDPLSVRESDSECSKHTCKYCNAIYSKEDIYLTHLLTHLIPGDFGISKGNFLCDYCDETFDSDMSRVAHIVKYKSCGGEKHICCFCNKKYCNEESYSKHMTVHFSENVESISQNDKKEKTWCPSLCKNCDLKFTSEAKPKRSKYSNANETNYPCKYCGKVFYTSKHYVNHAITHLSQKHSSARSKESWKDRQGEGLQSMLTKGAVLVKQELAIDPEVREENRNIRIYQQFQAPVSVDGAFIKREPDIGESSFDTFDELNYVPNNEHLNSQSPYVEKLCSRSIKREKDDIGYQQNTPGNISSVREGESYFLYGDCYTVREDENVPRVQSGSSQRISDNVWRKESLSRDELYITSDISESLNKSRSEQSKSLGCDIQRISPQEAGAKLVSVRNGEGKQESMIIDVYKTSHCLLLEPDNIEMQMPVPVRERHSVKVKPYILVDKEVPQVKDAHADDSVVHASADIEFIDVDNPNGEEEIDSGDNDSMDPLAL